MAEKRRLLNEMDKCFKKVDEGFEIFDEIMSKMSEANSDNQREKFQDDLKKEIKKLQRLRDQIKGWQNSSEIKDKDKLSHYRKLIEQRMETFKDIERENKTKPHSKQGLSAEDKLDPKEKEKSEAIEWLNNQIRRIQNEIDRTESKLESITSADSGSGFGRKGRSKKDDIKKNDKEKIEELKKHLERVKFHLTNLEVVMRLITNEKLEIKEVLTKLKEPVEIYIESLDPDSEFDPESLDPEDIYEELELSSYIPQLGGVSIGSIDEDEKSIAGENGGSPSAFNKDQKDTTSLGHEEHSPNGSDTKTSVFSQSAPSKSSAAAAPTKLMRLGSRISAENGSLSSPPPHTPPPPPPSIPYNTIAAGGVSASAATTSVANAAAPVPSASQWQSVSNETETVRQVALEDSAGKFQTMNNKELKSVVSQGVEEHSNGSDLKNSFSTKTLMTPIEAMKLATRMGNETTLLSTPSSQTPPPSSISYNTIAAGVSPIATTSVVASATTISATSAAQMQPTSQAQVSNVNDLNREMLRQVLQRPEEKKNTQPQTTTIPPRLGASPLGPVSTTGELEMHRSILEAAVNRMPVQMDSEKPRTYLPKMLCQTPPYYPQTAPINADTLEYYLRLSPETLFFTFYYMEGSRAQLLAAKALKKLSWRFHTKLMMWFQRHEEPKQITDDFEQGTYVYFDYEKWIQRKREQFTFEYKYLEDKEFE